MGNNNEDKRIDGMTNSNFPGTELVSDEIEKTVYADENDAQNVEGSDTIPQTAYAGEEQSAPDKPDEIGQTVYAPPEEVSASAEESAQSGTDEGNVMSADTDNTAEGNANQEIVHEIAQGETDDGYYNGADDDGDDFPEITSDTDGESGTDSGLADEENVRRKIAFNPKKVLITVGACAAALALIYGGGAAYYSKHFFYGTEIGGVSCSNMTTREAMEAIQNDIDNYSFTFYEKDGSEEVITGDEIYLDCAPVHNIDEIKAMQNILKWPLAKNYQSLPLDINVSYNEDSLYNRITELKFMEQSRQVMEGCNEKIHYADGAFVIDDDGEKNMVDMAYIFDVVRPKISELSKSMSLEEENCYTGISDNETVQQALSELNQYVAAKVTYTNGDNEPTVLDGGTINEWLSISDDLSVHLDTERIGTYVNELSQKYNTVGKERKFRTTGGSDITVSGGNYGWLVNNAAETEALTEIIKNGETTEREPVFKQTASAHGASNDFSNTYAEVSISAQHVWYYKNGELVVSTDCVTGNTANGNSTPTGVYSLVYKGRNTVLRGPGYASPVNYWMPFNGGVGFHDATWRSSFGGSIYRGGGSHGCVNLPLNAAKELYGCISSGDPVIVY